MDKIKKIKKKIDNLREKEQLELKKTIKHKCVFCGKRFKAGYYQTIRCKYSDKINRTRGTCSSSVFIKLIKNRKKLELLEVK